MVHIIPAHRQEECKFQVSLSYILRPETMCGEVGQNERQGRGEGVKGSGKWRTDGRCR